MKNIPLDAHVECADGPAGQTASVIVDPKTLQVTHVVVKEGKRPHTQRLVSADQIVESTPDLVRLACTTSELEKMQPFISTEYRYVEVPTYVGPESGTQRMPQTTVLTVDVERVPLGEVALHQGAEVEATDGRVGRVGELLLDPTSGEITHLVLEEHRLLGDRDIVLPLSVVDRVVKDTVYLTVDQESISAMLAIPTKWRSRAVDAELVVLVSQQAETANQALQVLKDLVKKDDLAILNAAVLVKEQDGKISLHETAEINPKHGTLAGAITGGLVGLLGGPVGVVIGAAAGAAAGHVAADRIDRGFPDEYLEKLEEGLQPGSSALVTLAEQESADRVAEALAAFEGQVLRQALTDDIMAQFTSPAQGEDAEVEG